MANQRRSIYEYNKEYYENSSKKYYSNGNAAEELLYETSADYFTEPDELPLRPEKKPVEAPVKHVRTSPVRKKRRKSSLDFIAFFVLITAMAATLMVCVGFLQKQSDINQLKTETKKLKADYTALKDSNDALEDELQTAVDYDYIYAVAVGKLGMVYPGENQIINYSVDNSAYVIQYEKVPDTYEEDTLRKVIP